MTPLQAIKEKCIDCSGDSAYEAKLCNITDCKLYPFRLGKNPFRKKIEISPERKKELADRMKEFTEIRKKANESAKTVTS